MFYEKTNPDYGSGIRPATLKQLISWVKEDLQKAKKQSSVEKSNMGKNWFNVIVDGICVAVVYCSKKTFISRINKEVI